MPFIGKTPETGAFKLIDSITTSATDTYALTVQGDHYFPESARNLIVSLNGVTQAPETAYTVSGSHIVFASALTASDVIDYILVIGDAVDIGTPSDGTVGNAQLKASLDLSGKTLTFTNDQISGNAVDGGTISNFASTGIDDNATSTAITIDANEQIGVGTIIPDAIFHTAKTQASGDVPIILENSGTSGVSTASLVFAGSGGGGAEKARIQAAVYGDGYMTFHTNDDSEKMRLDASGNLGLSATPDAHYTGYSVFNVGASAVVLGNETTSDTNVTMTINNAYLNTGASAWVYKNSDEATRYTQISGQHRWDTAASGTAGGTITWDESMRIDASGNLLVGKDTLGTANEGMQVKAAGELAVTRANNHAFILNRKSSDGGIALFQKDGTTVGSIYSYNGFLGIGSTSGNDAYLLLGSDFVAPATSTGTARDGAIDLGSTGRRFKDLYLSGGAYLGGTGSANHLDDYEEGTWEPQIIGSTANPSVTYHTDTGGKYVKIGQMVYVTGTIRTTAISGGSGFVWIVNIPFGCATRSNGDNSDGIGMAQTNIWNGTSTEVPTFVKCKHNDSALYIGRSSDTAVTNFLDVSDWGSTCMMTFTLVYHTN